MIYIDTHVHFHACFHPISFFNRVERNIRNIQNPPDEPSELSCCLFLTEAGNTNYFEKIQKSGLTFAVNDANPDDRWKVHGTSEPLSMLVTNRFGFSIYLIAGQQLQTSEGLEVLAIAPKYRLAEGKPIEKLIRDVVEANGLAIVPWGFGKWMGKRGKVLHALLERFTSEYFFWGDNGGRPKFLPEPSLFRLARQKLFRILPGSDPLPFPDEIRRVASFGLSLDGKIDRSEPAGQLKQMLNNPGYEFNTFGQLETFGNFVKHQILMQIVKRKSRFFK
jgi:hypothetical protein